MTKRLEKNQVTDDRPYFIYHVKIKGEEKWFFGTTENIPLSKIKVTKEQVRVEVQEN